MKSELDYTTIAVGCKTFNLSLVQVVCCCKKDGEGSYGDVTGGVTGGVTAGVTAGVAGDDGEKIKIVIDTSLTRGMKESDILDTFPKNVLNITEKSLKEREDHQNKLALDKLRNTNPKASAIGSRVFDKLMKACGDCHWTNDGGSTNATNIIIDQSILVVEPYLDVEKHVYIKEREIRDEIERVKKGENLERVRKIVRDVKEALEKEKGGRK